MPWPGQTVWTPNERALTLTSDLAVQIRVRQALSPFLIPNLRPAFPPTLWVQCLGIVNLIPNGAIPASSVIIAAGEVHVFASIRSNLTTLLNGVWSLATLTPVPTPLTLVPRAVSLAPIRLHVLPSIVLCPNRVPRWNIWLLVKGTRVLRCPNRVRNRWLPIPVSNLFCPINAFLAKKTLATPLEALKDRSILLLGIRCLAINTLLASKRGPTIRVPIPNACRPPLPGNVLVVASLLPLRGANRQTFSLVKLVLTNTTTFYPTCPPTRSLTRAQQTCQRKTRQKNAVPSPNVMPPPNTPPCPLALIL